MKLIFLGTGAGAPYKTRNVSALILDLMQEGQGLWLFDCGEATQHQLMRVKLNPGKINTIFITHLHADHVLGLPGLLTSRSMSSNAQPLTVYGPVGLKLFLETVFDLTHSYMTFPLQVVEIEEGEILKTEHFRVNAALLAHRIPSFGFRVDQAALPGKLKMEKVYADGIGEGPHLQKLKKGENITLSDGRIVLAQNYVQNSQPGKTVVICGDTQPTDRTVMLAQGADVLVHEATLEAAMQDKANSRGHSTAEQAAQVARDSGVQRLILTHLSARYDSGDELMLLKESRAIFPQTEIAHDLQTFDLNG